MSYVRRGRKALAGARRPSQADRSSPSQVREPPNLSTGPRLLPHALPSTGTEIRWPLSLVTYGRKFATSKQVSRVVQNRCRLGPRKTGRDLNRVRSLFDRITATELAPLVDSALEGHAGLESEQRRVLQALQEDNEKCEPTLARREWSHV